MAFTVNDVRLEAQQYINGHIHEDEAVRGVNACINSIGSRIWPEGKYTLTAEEDAWYNLPDDFARVVEIKDSKNRVYNNYLIRNRKIKFVAADDYTMTYITLPVKVEAAGDTIDLLDVFLPPMGKFLAANYIRLYEKTSTDMADRLIIEFQRDITDIFNDIEIGGGAFQVKAKW